MHVLVNCKAYDADPVAIAEAALDVADDTARVGVAPQTAAIDAVADTGVETWAQHVAATGYGSHTGSQHAGSAAAAGAGGTLINHSEHRRTVAEIDGAIEEADGAGLEAMVCANTPDQIAAVAALGPDAVAIEPPALIGTGTPVSQADPEIVTGAVEAAGDVDPTIDVYCGAGISTGEDVVAARELGADGVLLASGVAKAEDPAAALAELVDPL
jgi:triosephosphate isomerase